MGKGKGADDGVRPRAYYLPVGVGWAVALLVAAAVGVSFIFFMGMRPPYSEGGAANSSAPGANNGGLNVESEVRRRSTVK